MQRFDGKTILVTGAGSGIGAAAVRRLFAEGASIVAADVRKEAVDTVVSAFGGSDRIYGVGVDISNRDQVATFVSGAVQRFGKLHGLVNSAGIRGVGNVLDFEPEAWRKVLSVNLDGTFYVCQAGSVHMTVDTCGKKFFPTILTRKWTWLYPSPSSWALSIDLP